MRPRDCHPFLSKDGLWRGGPVNLVHTRPGSRNLPQTTVGFPFDNGDGSSGRLSDRVVYVVKRSSTVSTLEKGSSRVS